MPNLDPSFLILHSDSFACSSLVRWTVPRYCPNFVKFNSTTDGQKQQENGPSRHRLIRAQPWTGYLVHGLVRAVTPSAYRACFTRGAGCGAHLVPHPTLERVQFLIHLCDAGFHFSDLFNGRQRTVLPDNVSSVHALHLYISPPTIRRLVMTTAVDAV